MVVASHSTLPAATKWLDVVFLGSGFVLASWGSRIPQITEAARLGPDRIGVALLLMAAAMVGTIVLMPHLVQRIRPPAAIQAGAVLVTLALASLALRPPVAVLLVALVLVGIGTGICDLAMNVAGTSIDLADGKARMPRLHGMFSLGTVVGALGGTVASALGVAARIHVPLAALLFGALMTVAAGRLAVLLPDGTAPAVLGSRVSSFRGEWTNRRTLAIGIVLLGMAFAEGTANDWLALFLVDGYGQGHAFGAAGLTVFVVAMTVTRFAYSALASRRSTARRPIRRRYDLLLALSGAVVVAGTGLLLLATVVRHHSTPAALVLGGLGIAVWGAGAALPFPLALTAAAVGGEAHEAGRSHLPVTGPAGPVHDRAAASVSVVTAMGYGAALGGPPLIGWVAHELNYLSALLVVPLVVVLALLFAAICHPRPWPERAGLDPEVGPGPLSPRVHPPLGPYPGGAHERLSLEPRVDAPE